MKAPYIHRCTQKRVRVTHERYNSSSVQAVLVLPHVQRREQLGLSDHVSPLRASELRHQVVHGVNTDAGEGNGGACSWGNFENFENYFGHF